MFNVAESGVFEVAFGSAAGAEEEMTQLKRCHRVVERQLLAQISSKFGMFFGLLEDLQDLEEQTSQGVKTVQFMRDGQLTPTVEWHNTEYVSSTRFAVGEW